MYNTIINFFNAPQRNPEGKYANKGHNPLYDQLPTIVMCRSLIKYFDNVHINSSKKHCVHIMVTIKDIELKKIIEEDFINEYNNYKNDAKNLLNESKKWISENKLKMKKRVYKDGWRKYDSLSRMYDIYEMIDVELISVDDDANIIVKANTELYKLKYCNEGYWSGKDVYITKN
jgi:hypothetical protein